VDLSVLYTYGEAGMKDLRFSATTASGWSGVINKFSFTGTTFEDRKMAFHITHPKSAGKTASYWIDVTVASAKYKTTFKHRLNFKFKVATPFGDGQAEGMISDAAVARVKSEIANRLGGGRGRNEYVQCYSAKKHGWSGQTIHSRCDGKGAYMVVMRRPDTKRVFGGYYGRSHSRSGGYARGTDNRVAFLWRVDPSNANNINVMKKNTQRSYYVYQSSSYMPTWGGGHDLYCSGSSGNCYSNMDHSYDSPYGYGSGNARSYLTGSYSWNNKQGDYEVYIVK